MIGIVDYNAGNITSVERALKSLGIEYILSKNPQDLKDCSKLIFPGVGDAAYAMEQLAKTGFDAFLKDWAAQNKPLLGICLGLHLLFEGSGGNDFDTFFAFEYVAFKLVTPLVEASHQSSVGLLHINQHLVIDAVTMEPTHCPEILSVLV